MRLVRDLQKTLQRIDGKGYKAYKDIQGEYDFGNFCLYIDNVQSDPFAPPSRMRISISQDQAKFPEDLFDTRTRRVALEDFLTRQFDRAIKAVQVNKKGGEKGVSVSIDRGGQEILERTSMRVSSGDVQACFMVALPARGRTILARQAESILCQDLPRIVTNSLVFKNLDIKALHRHVRICEDQEHVRSVLEENGWVAFIGNGAILPRVSGVSDRPLSADRAVSFQSPAELEDTVTVPNQGKMTGMAIPKGVTLIVGGGYHGKSTLLKALERGVYNHVPDDGRDKVITEESAVKIRAEDGRSVVKVDIRPFISDLPFKERTIDFSSDNASGSTSQAANIMEALESESRLLLLDEDTSATNFMIRDGRMQQLVSKENEPITPFIDQVQDMYGRLGVSTIVVLGGSGDYFDVADTIIKLQEYRPYKVTTEAKEIASTLTNSRNREQKVQLDSVTQRIPLAECFRLKEKEKIKVKGLDTILLGRDRVDLSFLEQLVDDSQTRAIGEFFRLMGHDDDNGDTLSQRIGSLLRKIEERGLELLSPFRGSHPGNLALPRKQEVCAAINRLRRLRVR